MQAVKTTGNVVLSRRVSEPFWFRQTQHNYRCQDTPLVNPLTREVADGTTNMTDWSLLRKRCHVRNMPYRVARWCATVLGLTAFRNCYVNDIHRRKYSGAGLRLRSTRKSCWWDGSPRFPECEVLQGNTRHARNSRRPGPQLLRHFQLFSHFIIKITLNGRTRYDCAPTRSSHNFQVADFKKL